MKKPTYSIPCVVLLVTIIGLVGCAWIVEVQVLNFTNDDIVVVSIDPKLSEARYVAKSSERITIKTPYKLRIQRGSTEWTYDLPAVPPPKAFRKRTGVNKYVIAYAVQSDGLLIMLRPGSTNVVADSEKQPDGYPIRPR